MKSKIDRAMKSTKLLWVAIGILIISNLILFWEVLNPDKTIRGKMLIVEHIILEDIMGHHTISIRGKYSYLELNDRNGNYIRLMASGDTHSRVYGKGPSIRLKGWDGAKKEIYTRSLLTIPPRDPNSKPQDNKYR